MDWDVRWAVPHCVHPAGSLRQPICALVSACRGVCPPKERRLATDSTALPTDPRATPPPRLKDARPEPIKDRRFQHGVLCTLRVQCPGVPRSDGPLAQHELSCALGVFGAQSLPILPIPRRQTTLLWRASARPRVRHTPSEAWTVVIPILPPGGGLPVSRPPFDSLICQIIPEPIGSSQSAARSSECEEGASRPPHYPSAVASPWCYNIVTV
jgi:hypothetical protein